MNRGNVMDTNFALEEWLDSLAIEGRAPATLRTYREHTKRLREIAPTIDGRSQVALRHYLLDYRQTHAAASLRSTYVTWQAFFNWCVSEGLVAESPLKRLKAPPRA